MELLFIGKIFFYTYVLSINDLPGKPGLKTFLLVNLLYREKRSPGKPGSNPFGIKHFLCNGDGWRFGRCEEYPYISDHSINYDQVGVESINSGNGR